MARRSKPRWRALIGVGAYAALCVVLASAAWVAVGTAAAHGPAAAPSTIALAPTPTEHARADGLGDARRPTSTPFVWPSFPTAPTPSPTPGPFSMDIYKDGTFISQHDREACMAGAVQNMLNIIGPKVDLTPARQLVISNDIIANTTKTDSLNGGYGPAGWAITMTQLGGGHYKLLDRQLP